MISIIPKGQHYLFAERNGAFSESPRYLYFDLSNTHYKNKVHWLTSSKKTKEIISELRLPKAHIKWSPRSILLTIRAKGIIYSHYTNDVSWFLTPRAKKINLWHGMPFKKIEHLATNGPAHKILNSKGITRLLYRIYCPERFTKPNIMVAPNEKYQDILSAAFKINKSNVLIAESPKQHSIKKWEYAQTENYGKSTTEVSFLIDLKKATRSFSKRLLYLPTFRDNTHADYGWEEISNILIKSNSCLLLKLHPNDTSHPILELKSSNIIILDKKIDPAHCFSLSSALISDYSSIINEYLITRKPIIIFSPDIADYTKERDFLINPLYLKNTIQAHSIKELSKSILNLDGTSMTKVDNSIATKKLDYQSILG